MLPNQLPPEERQKLTDAIDQAIAQVEDLGLEEDVRGKAGGSSEFNKEAFEEMFDRMIGTDPAEPIWTPVITRIGLGNAHYQYGPVAPAAQYLPRGMSDEDLAR